MVACPATWQTQPDYSLVVHLIYGANSLHRYWGREIEAARYGEYAETVAVAQVKYPEGVQAQALVHALVQTRTMPDKPENRVEILKQVLGTGNVYRQPLEVRTALVDGDGDGGVQFFLRDGTTIEPRALSSGLDVPVEGTWIFVGTHENDPERRTLDPDRTRLKNAEIEIEELSPAYANEDIFLLVPMLNRNAPRGWSLRPIPPGNGRWSFNLPRSHGPLVLNKQWVEDLENGVISDFHFEWLRAEINKRMHDAPPADCSTDVVEEWRLRDWGIARSLRPLLRMNPFL